jgi:hypothetical protein
MPLKVSVTTLLHVLVGPPLRLLIPLVNAHHRRQRTERTKRHTLLWPQFHHPQVVELIPYLHLKEIVNGWRKSANYSWQKGHPVPYVSFSLKTNKSRSRRSRMFSKPELTFVKDTSKANYQSTRVYQQNKGIGYLFVTGTIRCLTMTERLKKIDKSPFS